MVHLLLRFIAKALLRVHIHDVLGWALCAALNLGSGTLGRTGLLTDGLLTWCWDGLCLLDASQVGPVLELVVQREELGYISVAMVHVQLLPGPVLLLHLLNDLVADAVEISSVLWVKFFWELHFAEHMHDVFAV